MKRDRSGGNMKCKGCKGTTATIHGGEGRAGEDPSQASKLPRTILEYEKAKFRRAADEKAADWLEEPRSNPQEIAEVEVDGGIPRGSAGGGGGGLAGRLFKILCFGRDSAWGENLGGGKRRRGQRILPPPSRAVADGGDGQGPLTIAPLPTSSPANPWGSVRKS